MDKIQKDINDALETARRLSLVKAIFGLSLYSLMVMIGTSLPISLFRMASEAGYDPAIPLTSMVTQLTSVEKGLIPPDSFFGFLFFLCCGHFTCFYIISKRNRIKAYLMTQIFQLFLLVITYYSWFVAILYLIPLVAVRIVYWIGFVLSLIYLIYILVTKQRARKDYFSSEYYKAMEGAANIVVRKGAYSDPEAIFQDMRHWFAPVGQDKLDVVGIDPKTKEETPLNSFQEYQEWYEKHVK